MSDLARVLAFDDTDESTANRLAALSERTRQGDFASVIVIAVDKEGGTDFYGRIRSDSEHDLKLVGLLRVIEQDFTACVSKVVFGDE